jgi:glycogen synthase
MWARSERLKSSGLNSLSMAFLAFVALQLSLVLISYYYLHSHHSTNVHMAYRRFEPVPQINPWDTPKTISSHWDTTPLILHVSKEFGDASFGGIGTMVTQLTSAQVQYGLNVSVLIPYYKYLRRSADQLVTWVEIDIGWWCGWSWQMFISRQIPVRVPIYTRTESGVVVYFAGAADMFPYSRAFDASDVFGIYYSDYWLDMERQDVFFNRVAAAFIAYLAGKSHRLAVHVHASTNAPAILMYNQHKHYHVGFTYTLHDYSFEQRHSLLVSNMKCFDERFYGLSDDNRMTIDESSLKFKPRVGGAWKLDDLVLGERWYPFGVGIMRSDSVTFVSDYLLKKLMAVELDFEWRSILLPYLQYRTNRGDTLGITNGVDISRLNPFTDYTLVSHGVNYPLDSEVAGKLFGNSIISQFETVTEAKDAAKSVLCSRYDIFVQSCDRPLMLFIGRFSHEKGMIHVKRLVPRLRALNVNLILMGQPNDFDMTPLYDINTPHLYIIDTPARQRQLGTLVRAAADFLFLPTYSESFGLVAIEALMFGSAVVTSGVGGLGEFLRPFPETRYNAFLFDVNEVKKHESRIWLPYESSSLNKAVGDALVAYWRMRSDRNNNVQLGYISTALNYRWITNRKRAVIKDGRIRLVNDNATLGAVEKYLIAYNRR